MVVSGQDHARATNLVGVLLVKSGKIKFTPLGEYFSSLIELARHKAVLCDNHRIEVASTEGMCVIAEMCYICNFQQVGARGHIRWSGFPGLPDAYAVIGITVLDCVVRMDHVDMHAFALCTF